MGTRSSWITAFERVLAGVALLLSSPLLATGALVSFAHYRRFPFFVHDRVGRDGRVFRLVKIRTLPPSTNPYAAKYDLDRAAVSATMNLVRKLHFDEIPQLAHVALGQMTFVGPRPEMPSLHERLPPAFAAQRTAVLPGLTCLWQISPHSAGLIGERPEYDRLYVDHRNGRLDLWILGRTVLKMLTGRTTHLHEIPRWAMAPQAQAPRQSAHTGARRDAATSSPSIGLID